MLDSLSFIFSLIVGEVKFIYLGSPELLAQ